MDCVCNKNIPESTPDRIIIRPAGKTWINGLASRYSDEFPKDLLGKYMTQKEFQEFIGNVNNSIEYFWPCPLCFGFGYVCSLCTLGTISPTRHDRLLLLLSLHMHQGSIRVGEDDDQRPEQTNLEVEEA